MCHTPTFPRKQVKLYGGSTQKSRGLKACLSLRVITAEERLFQWEKKQPAAAYMSIFKEDSRLNSEEGYEKRGFEGFRVDNGRGRMEVWLIESVTTTELS
jgi:hypothetical protein